MVGMIQEVAAPFATHRPSYLTQRTLFHCCIVQSLYALAHWSLLTLFCFLNSGFLTAILPYRPASLGLLLTVDVNTLFLRHWFRCAVMFGAVILLSCKMVTNEIILCSCCFWSISPIFGLILSRFLIFPNSIIHFSSGNFYFCTKEEKCLQINFSKDI